MYIYYPIRAWCYFNTFVDANCDTDSAGILYFHSTNF